MAYVNANDCFHWDEASGRATFEGHDITELSREYKTPFYLLSQKQLRSNFRTFQEAFSNVDGGLSVYYSVKSNFESMVLSTLAEMGCGAEISGAMDMELAKRAHMKPEQVVYDGPYKPAEDIEAAMQWGVHIINIESLTEARLVNDIAKKLNRKVDVGIRIDPLLSKPYYDKVITTYRKKFGFPIDQAPAAAEQVAAFSNLNFVGLMTHIGSQVFQPGRYLTTLDKMFDLAGQLKQRGLEVRELNIGGGYPAQSMRNLRLSRRFVLARLLERFNRIDVRAASITEFGQKITQRYNDLKRTTGLTPRLAIEPGRCLVSNACVVVGKVLIVKNDWLFTDVSINNLPENLFFSEWRTAYPGHRPNQNTHKYNISGPTLATQDVHFFQRDVPNLKEGDALAILDTGAYSIARSNQFTRPRVAVYSVNDDGNIGLIRRAETVDDVLVMQVWPDRDEKAQSTPERTRKVG
jgi:diaminopimelate decarboxylase